MSRDKIGWAGVWVRGKEGAGGEEYRVLALAHPLKNNRRSSKKTAL